MAGKCDCKMNFSLAGEGKKGERERGVGIITTENKKDSQVSEMFASNHKNSVTTVEITSEHKHL